MSLVTWNGRLLLSPEGKLVLGPAAAACCCEEEPPASDCDCECATMPVSVTAQIGALTCTFGFTDSVDDPEIKCVFSYRTGDVCFDATYQINEVILECPHAPGSKWKVYVLADYGPGSLGGLLELPAGACPPPGTYDVDLYDTSFAYVVTCTVTIP